MTKRRFALAGAAAALGALALAATVAAAGPRNGQAAGQAAADALGLTREQVTEMRQEGLSLAQIAEKQGVSVSSVVDALAAGWSERIQERVENGALTDEQAAALQEQVRERAEAMVRQTDLGGMQGAAVGAGPANGAGQGAGGGMGPGARGTGVGPGACDGTGPHGAGRP
jgi:lambda repressor-like predicted transcriptional regulator